MIVADHQLSLAIGKEGQNARLAAKLTDWKIDIKSETQYREMLEATWMSDFDEAVAAHEAERGDLEEEEADSFEDGTEVGAEVEEETASDYLDKLSETIESLDDGEPEA